MWEGVQPLIVLSAQPDKSASTSLGLWVSRQVTRGARHYAAPMIMACLCTSACSTDVKAAKGFDVPLGRPSSGVLIAISFPAASDGLLAASSQHLAQTERLTATKHEVSSSCNANTQ